MKAFTELFNAIDQTTKTNAKVNAMAEYFSHTKNEDAIWAITLLTGRRPKRPFRSSDMRAWATELAGIPYWLLEESYSVVGDFSETVSLLVDNTRDNDALNISLQQLMSELISLYDKTDEEKKTWLFSYWNRFSKDELFVFNKLISGNFRMGVSAQLVFKALAKAYTIDEKTIAHRLMGNWSPVEDNIQTLLLSNEISTDHSKPYPFYLAYQLDVPFADLGDVHDWQVEKKYDGIRGQLIKRNDEIHVWSRGEELMNDKFLEFQSLKDILSNGTVIDGEVLPFKDGQIMSFAAMQKRIGRKNLSKKILGDVPLCMMCYDILEFEGNDVRSLPLKERRKKLEQLLAPLDGEILKLSPVYDPGNWEELNILRERSKEEGCEGLMLKHKESVYETGRRRGKWWKWKVDPYTIDAVLIYAQSGSGRRANLYTDYTFAVWDNNELVPFAKAYSGLTDKEIYEVDNWIKKNTIEKFGPVRSVRAELVFEIAFEGINESSRHKSGVALRFPRIANWRKDKPKEEANTKQDLLALLKQDKLNK